MVTMRKERSETLKHMDMAASADKVVAENRELRAKIEELEGAVLAAEEGQKTLMLQRKTLISNKESVQKELDKVMKKHETAAAEKEKQLREKSMAYEAMKMEADATI